MAQQADSEIPFGTVDSAEAKQMIDSGEYQVIDVRMPNQFAKAHIPDSVLAPLPVLLQKPWEFLADDKIIFVCEVGQSSQVACEIGRRHGLGRSLQPGTRHRGLAQRRLCGRGRAAAGGLSPIRKGVTFLSYPDGCCPLQQCTESVALFPSS